MTQAGDMAKYPSGFDIAWLASDSRGHVGVFVTGGSGPIPARVLEFCGDSIREIESQLQTLPIGSDFKLWAELNRPDDFIDFAKRGLFAFDWRDAARVMARRTSVYERITSPSRPTFVHSLPAELMKIAEVSRIPLSFAETTSVDVNAVLPCVCE